MAGKLHEMEKEPTNGRIVLVQSEGHVTKLRVMDEKKFFVDVHPNQPEERSEVEDGTEGEESVEKEIARLKEELASMVSCKDVRIAELESELKLHIYKKL